MTTDAPRPVLATSLAGAMQAAGGGLGWSLVPALMPAIATDLGLTHTTGGMVWGAAALGIALASPLGGAAVDRYGTRRVAGIAMLVGAAACAARAFATDAWTLGAAMLAFGLHIGFVAPAIPKALASHVAPAHFGRANGIALVCYTLGTAITVLVGRTVLMPAFGGWRPTMVAAAVVMAAVGLVWLALHRDRVELAPHAGLGDVLRLVRNGSMRRVAAMHFLLFGGYLALLGYLPRALAESGLSAGSVGLVVAAWLGLAAVANLAGPWISDRMGKRRPVILVGAAVASLGLALLALAPSGSAVWLLGLSALGGGSFAPLLFALPLQIEGVGPARAGAALGLLMLVGQVGGFLLPVATGAVAESSGPAAALLLLAAVHLLIVAPAFGLDEAGAGTMLPPSRGATGEGPRAAAAPAAANPQPS